MEKALLEGYVVDVLVQSRRNATAATRLTRKLLKTRDHVPRVMVTDKLRSYNAAKRRVMPSVEHRSHKASTIGPRIHVNPSGDENE
jgi:putative transposase